jgi:hypothetical protein
MALSGRILTVVGPDPVLLSVITDVFECLATASYQATVSQALPPLANALASVSNEETWVTSSALEIITGLMRGAQAGQLGEGFFASLGPALFKSVGEAEDRDIVQVRLFSVCPRLLALELHAFYRMESNA